MRRLIAAFCLFGASAAFAGAQQYEPLSASVQAILRKAVVDHSPAPDSFRGAPLERANWLSAMSPRLMKRIPNDQARCRYLTTTGVLTGNRNVIVPNDWEGTVFCNNTGAFTTTFKTSGGSGVVVAQGKRAILIADGTNVVRVTADT